MLNYHFLLIVVILIQEISDEGILWQVNFARFHQHFIDEVRIHNIACGTLPGCSLGVRDRRILRLNFARTLKELHSFIIILLLLYTILLLLQFLMKTLLSIFFFFTSLFMSFIEKLSWNNWHFWDYSLRIWV